MTAPQTQIGGRDATGRVVVGHFTKVPEGTRHPVYHDEFRARWFGTLQDRVGTWMDACFTSSVVHDPAERNHRFLEEALELVQSLGCTADETRQLVDYVFGRPVGDPPQEVGGVMVTLAALCRTHGIDLLDAQETELTRCWDKIERIRAKHAQKPSVGPLPGVAPLEAHELTNQDCATLAAAYARAGGDRAAQVVWLEQHAEALRQHAARVTRLADLVERLPPIGRDPA